MQAQNGDAAAVTGARPLPGVPGLQDGQGAANPFPPGEERSRQT